MKCDQCENEATVHEWTKAGGQRHLCERCAMSAGLPVQPQTQITQIIAQNIASMLKPAMDAAGDESGAIKAEPAPEKPTESVKPPGPCPTCGMELSQFRNTGLLGCPECYRTFEVSLSPLIARAHENATHHTGKTPRLAAKGPASSSPVPLADRRVLQSLRAEHSRRLEALRKQLGESVAAEQYERAAKLRDEVARLECDLKMLDDEGVQPDQPSLMEGSAIVAPPPRIDRPGETPGASA